MNNQNLSYIIFSGTSHVEFAQEVCGNLGRKLGKAEIETFPDGEIGVRILENVRGRDVFVLQSIAHKPNFYLMETLIIVDALKRASAKSITAVLPYFGYCRQDRRDKGREPITARLVANMLETAGVDHVLTMDLHAQQIQGFFNIPVDNLYAKTTQSHAISSSLQKPFTVVVPDIGSVKLARYFAESFGQDLVIIDKKRDHALSVKPQNLIGSINTKQVLIVDDMSATGQTLLEAAKICRQMGAKKVVALVTHTFRPISPELEEAIDEFFYCNTIPNHDPSPKVKMISVSQVFSTAISSIVNADSISSIFE